MELTAFDDETDALHRRHASTLARVRAGARSDDDRDSGKDVNIADIASQDEFQITGQVSGRPPCADVHFDGSAKFDVTLL